MPFDAELHVLPLERGGGWIVRDDGDRPVLLSSHDRADEAELAARRRAASCGAACIYVHDRYRRVRSIAVTG